MGFGLIFRPVVAVMTALSVIPAFVDAVYVWTADEVTEKEPWSLVLLAFFLAMVLTGIPLAVNTVMLPLFSGAIGMTVFFFMVVAPVEEAAKGLAIRIGPFRSDRFDAVIDGTVYGAFAGLGFATMENALYISGTSVFGATGLEPTLSGAVARAGMAPGHVLFSAIVGYYVGLAKFSDGYEGALALKGLLIAGLLHGALNTAIWSLSPDDVVGESIGVVLDHGFAGLTLLSAERIGVLLSILAIYGIAAAFLLHKIKRYNADHRGQAT
jgi:RsiW-degrading membrane proteinase PrsW (M82 family)